MQSWERVFPLKTRNKFWQNLRIWKQRQVFGSPKLVDGSLQVHDFFIEVMKRYCPIRTKHKYRSFVKLLV